MDTIPDRSFPMGISVDEARQLVVESCSKQTLEVKIIKLENSLNRILAEDIIALINVPGFKNSAMDGYAIRSTDLPTHGEKPFRRMGQLLAGGFAAPALSKDECVQIMTGAPLPDGADTVVIKEQVRQEGEQIWIGASNKCGANTRPAGEDYQAGETALLKGTRLSASQMGVLASLGFSEVKVTRRLRAVLLTTGDELVTPGIPLGYSQIYDSNRYSLTGMLHDYGVELLHHQHVRDGADILRSTIQQSAEHADFIITSGGVSAGDADFIPKIIEEIGKIYLWKVRIKPGMPFLFGKFGKAWIFSLPGNPVSSMATFLTLVRPALDVLSGCHEVGIRPWRARLSTAIRKFHPRTEFQRASLRFDEHGTLWAHPFPRQGSGILRSMAEADALIIVPEEIQLLEESAVIEVLPF